MEPEARTTYNGGFTRWYDRIPELSQAVKMLEKVPLAYQQTICQLVIEEAEKELWICKLKTGLKKLGRDRVLGLMQSKSKRRWYDEDPVVHLAFNRLYSVEDDARRSLGIKIIAALQTMEGSFAQSNVVRSNNLLNLCRQVFAQPVEALQAQLKPQKQQVVPQAPEKQEPDNTVRLAESKSGLLTRQTVPPSLET